MQSSPVLSILQQSTNPIPPYIYIIAKVAITMQETLHQ